jgi:hypothetical protein
MTLLKSDGAKEEDDEVHSCFKTIANDSASWPFVPIQKKWKKWKKCKK